MIITFDPLNKIQHSLVRWKALAKALLLTPPTPIRPHNQRARSQNSHGLIILKKKQSSLSENDNIFVSILF